METNYFDMIPDYIEDILSPNEKAIFEQQLSKNNGLQKELVFQQFLYNTLNKHQTSASGVNKLKNTLGTLNQQYFATANQQVPNPGKVVSFKKWLVPFAVAASIILAVMVFLPNGGIDDYTIPSVTAVAVRGNNNTDSAAILFNNKKYAEALPVYKNLLQQDSSNTGNQFFYALSLLQTKQYNMALPLFEQLHNGASVYKAEATFFAALCAYKLAYKPQALNYAQQVQGKNINFKQAKQIIDLCKK